jgi:hypothetical protein
MKTIEHRTPLHVHPTLPETIKDAARPVDDRALSI